MAIKCRECGEEAKLIKGKYHWKEVGLDNVYLEGEGVKQWECANGHKTVQINAVGHLLKVLAGAVAKKLDHLTGKEVRFLRKSIKMRANKMAALLGMRPESYSKIENGHDEVGSRVDRMVRLVYRDPEDVEAILMVLTDVQKDTEGSWDMTAPLAGQGEPVAAYAVA